MHPSRTPVAQRLTPFPLSAREQSHYSLCRAILAAAHEKEGGLYRNANCLELEVSAEIERSLPSSVKKHGGIFIPFVMRAGLDTKTSTKGAELVFTEPGSFTEYLYAKLVCRALGAEVLDGLQGNIGLPKENGKVTGAWVAENPGVDVTDSNLTLGQVVISPKTYTATTSFSRQLLAQSASSAKIDQVVTRDLARDAAVALDQAALVGTGAAAHQPVGILNTVGTQVFTLSGDTGNGAPATYGDCCEMIELIENQNADFGSLGWVTAPPIATKLRQTPRSTSIALPVLTDADSIGGWPAMVTTSIPKNLTAGTGTNLSILIFGKWDSLTLGLWGQGFELVVDPYRLKKQNMIETTSLLFCDVGVRLAQAFVIAKNVAKA